MILTSPMDYDSVCINGSTVQFLSGITLAVSTVNIFIFLFDLYIKYDIMSYDPSNEKEQSVKDEVEDDDELEDDEEEVEEDEEAKDDDEEAKDDDESEKEDDEDKVEEKNEVKEEIVV
jgi:hypothetical protein